MGSTVNTSVKVHLLLPMCFLYVNNKISKSKINKIFKTSIKVNS